LSPFTLIVKNLRGLRRVEWSPSGVCALIGPNGSGKSTLLLVLRLLRVAMERGLPEAVATVFGGSTGLRNRHAVPDEAIEVQVTIGEIIWRLELLPSGPSVDRLAAESLYAGERMIFARDSLGNFTLAPDERMVPDARLGLRAVLDTNRAIPEVVRMAEFVRSIDVYHDLDTYRLRTEGSNIAHSDRLHTRGANALAVLRRWRLERPEQWRYDNVLAALRAAFPNIVQDIDFQEAGTTVAGRVYPPGADTHVPVANEANGLISMLVSMCALVSCEPGGVVALDEAGDAMHPFALRVFLRQAEQLASRRNLVVLLASHNTVLIDHFNGSPARVFALGLGEGAMPVALDRLKDPEWLAQFLLGELYADGDLGSNSDVISEAGQTVER